MRLIIVNSAGDKYLSHVGHTYVWTTDRTLAMEYSKPDVAQALAAKYCGTVKPA